MLLILIALAIGLVYASLLYLFSKKYSKPLTVLLFAFRTIVVAVLVVLFVNPYIKQKTSNIEQPIIVFAQDNSASVAMTADSVYYKRNYPKALDSIQQALDKSYDVETVLFGSSAGNGLSDSGEINFSEQYTNVSNALSTIGRQYYKKNVGAVVLLSDGIVNQGVNPELNIDNYPFPIYTVTLGDTVAHPNMAITEVKYNKTVPANMLFPLRVTANATNCKGKDMDVKVKMDGVEVGSAKASVSSNRFSKTFDFNIDSENEGTKQIDIYAGDRKRTVFITVTDKKYRVLCIAKAPHPDIAAIKSALDDHFEFDVKYGESVENIGDYDLLLLHQTADIRKDVALPTLYVVGPATDFEVFNQAQDAVTIKHGAVSSNLDIRGRYNNGFGLFTVSSDIKNELRTYPPLALPHLEMMFNQRHDELLLMNIMDVETPNPLLAFSADAGGNKTAFLFGTGCWRWKLYEYYHHKNNDGFNEIFNKTVKYLLTEKDKELTVNHKDSYITTESVSLTAELRNPNRELVNEPELSLTLRNKITGDSYDYVFSKGDNTYSLNIGMLPEGIYNYSAHATLGGVEYNARGTFPVEAIGIEAQDLTADINRMRSLADQTGGKHYYITEIRKLAGDLKNDERITSISREETRYDDLINMKALFFIILGIITMEWVLRKMFGIY